MLYEDFQFLFRQKAIRARSEGRCEHCAFPTPWLNTHHTTYLHRRGREPLEVLVDLCRPCHKAAHELNQPDGRLPEKSGPLHESDPLFLGNFIDGRVDSVTQERWRVRVSSHRVRVPWPVPVLARTGAEVTLIGGYFEQGGSPRARALMVSMDHDDELLLPDVAEAIRGAEAAAREMIKTRSLSRRVPHEVLRAQQPRQPRKPKQMALPGFGGPRRSDRMPPRK